MKKYFSEAIGTFALVFCGTGAIIINDVTGGAVTHVGVAVTFGAIVLAMIYTYGDISGAHINPAVTIGFWFAGRFKGREVFPYILSQLAGAFSASVTLKMLFPVHSGLGTTLPAGPQLQTFILEIILTFLLMLVILHVSSGPKEKGVMAGIAVGTVVMMEAMFAGPITGASMNPARSIAPAIVSGHIESLWIYIAAPVTGALAAVLCCYVTKGKECIPFFFGTDKYEG